MVKQECKRVRRQHSTLVRIGDTKKAVKPVVKVLGMPDKCNGTGMRRAPFDL